MSRLAIISKPLLVMAGCLPEDGKDIGRPADQGFGGSDRPEDPVVMTHRFTAIGLAGSYALPVTVTMNGRSDADPAPTGYRVELPCDGVAFSADPGLGGGSAGGSLRLNVVDHVGTTTVQVVAVEFNP